MIELIIGGAIVGGFFFLVLWAVSTYNGFISLKNSVENAWAQINVFLKKRFDLVPNLVETVKGYAKHEKETFKQVTEARAQMANAKGVKETADAANIFSQALKSLFAVSERYPELKANQNFLELQNELTAIEAKIAYWRSFYNETVLNLNTQIETVPQNIMAGFMKLTKKDYFEIPEAEKEPIKVKF